MSTNGTAVAPSALAPSSDSIYARVTWRFMPLLFVCYVVAYLDRVNVGFAKLQMLNDLHFSEAMYGFGAGIFFVGYFFFEVPSNLLLHRLGARRWIARIMVTWAVISAATAWVSSPTMFYVLRFVLGIAEAGFFPGLVLYLTYWFPARRRGRMVAFLMSGNPVSGIVGGPLSGFIMQRLAGHGGLAGWQWLFVLEAVPALVLGAAIYFFLDDRVKNAKWLSQHEREFIQGEIDAETRTKSHATVRQTFTSLNVWTLCAILFGIVMGSYAVGFWQPTIIKGSGITDSFTIGLLTVLPYATALVAMLVVGRHADRTRERRWHVVVPQIVAASGFVLCAYAGHDTWIALLGLTLAASGVITALPMFWALPTSFLGGTGAAAGIALINSTGNLAGFVSPALVGWLKTLTGSLDSSLFLIAGSLIVSALLILARMPARLVNQ
ncbi:Putative metabolite transport protein NicT [Paraburkholderia graminis C4D1M]|uniref:Putative tartrate transporter n=1 Tax=Paraburkholderia graminis (strain ATCC 700544 / DSM 17151 / LMG 18924 / NCIMB 13744 / C4D1M) TaxID=396598 RepID=B1G6J0_PARG4|nr:MFS transporter [Paraburkholderia graminis]EDT08237.1 major facilitator superfamily MFS_1 [Paraburkholderia graminis C4D1M]CAB3723540.1 Putative metabolite transport protein NicT [Paraburkholderia graminis C4D1M]